MKIAVLVSGGVDSSVALRLLQAQGHDVEAFYLKIWLEDELSYLGTCPWQEDLEYAQAVCDAAGVKLNVVSLQKEYWDRVVSYTISEIHQGRTPNPDILCNSRVKFGAFLDAIGNDYDKVATGHYARVEQIGKEYHLLTTPDEIKDQTYFLSHLSQEQLSRTLFPIGDLKKEHVRQLAQEFELANKDRKDSQGICFLGKLKFRDFVKHHLGIKEGKLIELETNKVIGKHEGYWFYTVGQRQGLGLSGGPWYVVGKDVSSNIVYISKNYYSEDKIRNRLIVTNFNYVGSGVFGDASISGIKVKLRHGPKMQDVKVTLLDTGDLDLQLSDNDQGIAPGQFAVLYKDDRCLGGGVIAKAL